MTVLFYMTNINNILKSTVMANAIFSLRQSLAKTSPGRTVAIPHASSAPKREINKAINTRGTYTEYLFKSTLLINTHESDFPRQPN